MRSQFGFLKKLTETVDGVWRYNVLTELGSTWPRSMMINLTYQCNSKCRMCHIWQRPRQKLMSFTDWKKIAKEPIFKEIKTLTISGGEAFLYDEYTETVMMFLETIPKLERLVLNTNGFLTKRIVESVKKISKQAKKKGVRLEVGISLDGDQKTHDGIRRVKNGFAKVKKTVEELKKLALKTNFKISISTLLLNRNIAKFDEIESLWQSWKVDYGFQLIGFNESFVDNIQDKNNLGFGKNYKISIIETLDKLEKRGGGLNFMSYYWADMKNMYQNRGKRTTPCPYQKDSLVIDGLGNVYYCLSTQPIGNFVKEKRKISEIYFDSKNLARRRKMAKTICRKCNSACEVYKATAYDLKKFLWFRFTGKLWPGN